eukprot:s3008_g7.t1
MEQHASAVKWIQQKKSSQPIVLAGDMQKILQTTVKEASAQKPPENGNLHPDPWATWVKNHGSTGLSMSNQPLKPMSSAQNMSQPPRKLESPIEDKFQRQDEQIQQFRSATEKEIQSLRDNMSKLEKVVEGQKTQMERNVETTASEFRSLRADTAAQFQTMAEMFKDSLSAAIQAHDGAMNAQFSEIKSMIAAGPSKLSPPSKKLKQAAAEHDPYLSS